MSRDVRGLRTSFCSPLAPADLIYGVLCHRVRFNSQSDFQKIAALSRRKKKYIMFVLHQKILCCSICKLFYFIALSLFLINVEIERLKGNGCREGLCSNSREFSTYSLTFNSQLPKTVTRQRALSR